MIEATKPPFMSYAPKPQNFPLEISPLQGACLQGSEPTGTVSMWLEKINERPVEDLPRRIAMTFGRSVQGLAVQYFGCSSKPGTLEIS